MWKSDAMEDKRGVKSPVCQLEMNAITEETLGPVEIGETRKRKTTVQYSPEKRKTKVGKSDGGNESPSVLCIVDSSDEEDFVNEKYVYCIHSSTHLINPLYRRPVTISERNLHAQIECAVLRTKLESRDEIITLKLQLEQLQQKYDRIASKFKERGPIIEPVTVAVNNTLNERNVRHLFRHIKGNTMDTRIASLVYWNEHGQLVVPIRGHYRLGDLIHLFSDLATNDYEPGLLDATLFLEGNCTIFSPYSFEYLCQLGHAHLFNATQAECFTHDPESYANLFNQRNILQNLVVLDILNYCFAQTHKRLYAPELLSHTTLMNLVSSIADIELLPLQPCLLTIAFSIPIRPKSLSVPGDKKSCTYCGSSAFIEHPKRCELPGKQLRNHISKTCPLVLLGKNTVPEKYSLDANTLADEVINQLNEIDAVYLRCHIQTELTRRYYKFFGHNTTLPVPEKFSTCLIDGEGNPYPIARIRSALDTIHQARHTHVDFTTSITQYSEWHHQDVTRLTNMMRGTLASVDVLRLRVYGQPNMFTGFHAYTQSVAFMMASLNPSPQPIVHFGPPMDCSTTSTTPTSLPMMGLPEVTEDPCHLFMGDLY